MLICQQMKSQNILIGFKIWIDTRETSDDKANKGAFLTAVGKEAFTLLKTLVYPKTLRDVSITEIKETLLCRVTPAQFEIVERAKFHTLIRNPNEQFTSSKFAFNARHLSVLSRDT